MEIGRYTPSTARWVIDQIKQINRRLAGLPTREEVRSRMGVSHDQRAIHVENTDDTEAVPFACMQVVGRRNPRSGYKDYTYLQVTRPTDQYGRDGWYVFNGPNAIPAGKYGIAYTDNHVNAYAVSAALGQRLLPKIDSWRLTKDASGWLVMIGTDDVRDDIYRVMQTPMVGTMWFRTPSGGIPAISSGTFGKAICTLKTKAVDGSGNVSLSAATDENAADITHVVHNASTEIVPGNIDILATNTEGLWEENWTDCNA